jgi:hypothetical protein
MDTNQLTQLRSITELVSHGKRLALRTYALLNKLEALLLVVRNSRLEKNRVSAELSVEQWHVAIHLNTQSNICG